VTKGALKGGAMGFASSIFCENLCTAICTATANACHTGEPCAKATIAAAKVGAKIGAVIGAVDLSTTHIYGFCNITNGSIIAMGLTNLTISYDANNAFKLALQVPKSEYVASLVDDVYCDPGINNTETCKVLLDADQQMKDDYAADFTNNSGGIKLTIENQWNYHWDTIQNNIADKWNNDNNIQYGYEMYSFDSFAFKGRIIATSNRIWFKEGDNKRIFVENQSLKVDYYVDSVYVEYNGNLYETILPYMVDFHFNDSTEEANKGNEYRQFIADYYNNVALPDMKNYILQKEHEILKPIEEQRVNNDTKFEPLRAIHITLGLAETMKLYNVPKPDFVAGYNCYPSCDTSDLRNSSIPNPNDYNIDPNALNGIDFSNIPLYRTGYITEEEFLPQEPPNMTQANWTIYLAEVNILRVEEVTNILYDFNNTDVVVIVPETKPELTTLGNLSIRFTPNESINSGDIVTIDAVILNFGTTNSTNFEVKFYDGNPNDGGILIGSDTINVSALWVGIAQANWTASAGEHNIYVVVDPDDLVAEINESNNVANKTINVESSIKNYSMSDLYYRYETCNNPIYSADDGYVQVTLSQPFKFYDKEYSTIYIGTNGYITFDGGSYQYYNIPQMFMNTKMIAVDAGDLVSTIHICSINNRIVIRWQGRHYGYSDNVDVQAILYSNGNIKMNLNSVGIMNGGWPGYAITGVSKGDSKYYTLLTTNNNLSYGLSLPYGNYSSIDSSFEYETCNNPIYSADDGYVQVTLSQPFKFYDKEYSTIYIGTNGYITFDGGSYQYYNIPQMFMNTKMIAVDAGDLVSTIHICSINNRIVIRWQGRHYGYSDNVDVQAILYSNGNIKMNLNSVGIMNGGWPGYAITGVSKGDSKYYTSLTTNNNLSYVLFKPPDYSIK